MSQSTHSSQLNEFTSLLVTRVTHITVPTRQSVLFHSYFFLFLFIVITFFITLHFTNGTHR